MERKPESEADIQMDFWAGPTSTKDLNNIATRDGKYNQHGSRSLVTSHFSSDDQEHSKGYLQPLDTGRTGSTTDTSRGAKVQSARGSRSSSKMSERPSSGNSSILQRGARGILSEVPRTDSGSLSARPRTESWEPPTTTATKESAAGSEDVPTIRRCPLDMLQQRQLQKRASGSLSARSRKGSLEPPTRIATKEFAPAGEDIIRRHPLDMSQRTQRRYALHKHRMAESRGPVANVEKEEQLPQEDLGLCGFRVDDKVEVAGGPDAEGPWKNMGEGVVRGVASRNKGYLQICFKESGESFSIKACNLWNRTDPSRSGKLWHQYEKNLHLRNREGWEPYEDNVAIASMEPTMYTNTCGLSATGLEVGDTVQSNHDGVFRELGVVVKEGNNPDEVMVQVGALGVRCFKSNRLMKVIDGKDKKKAARIAKENVPNRQWFTLSLEEASSEFSDAPRCPKRLEQLPPSGRFVRFADREDPFAIGKFVRVQASSSPAWAAMGIGCIRGHGPHEGTLQVQFDSGGEVWTFLQSQLECAPKEDDPNHSFKDLDSEMLRTRGG